MARKKANNRMLVILLALIAVVCVALWYADKVEREGKAAAAAEQPADEAAEALAVVPPRRWPGRAPRPPISPSR